MVEAALYTVSLTAQRISPWSNSCNQSFHLIAYVLIGFVNFVLGYMSFTLLPLGDASALVLSAPIYTCILAWALLGERLQCLQLPLLLLNALGLICLCRPTQLQQMLLSSSTTSTDLTLDSYQDTRLIGVLCALTAAVTSAMMFVSNRFLGRTPVSVILWWWAVASAVLSFVVAIWFRHQFALWSVRLPCSRFEMCLTALNVIAAISAQFLLTVALKIESAGPVSVIRSSDIAFAFVLQLYFVPGEKSLGWFSLVGAILILLSVIGTVLLTTRPLPTQSHSCDSSS